MKLADLKKKLSGGEKNTADPSRAFGSEAEMMEALRAQNFTPPPPRPSAADVVRNIKDRIARPTQEPQAERPPRDNSAARAYAPEAMAQPEWENPFTSPTPVKKPPRETPVYENLSGSGPSYRPSAPAYGAPYPMNGYAYPQNPYYSGYTPAYDPRYAPQQPMYAPPYATPNPYQPPYAGGAYYPYAQPVYPSYAQNTYAPPYTPPYAPAEAVPVQPMADTAARDIPQQSTPSYAGFAPDYVPPSYAAEPPRAEAPVRTERRRSSVGDIRYLLWSGSIVSGIVLTLVAFVYACTL